MIQIRLTDRVFMSTVDAAAFDQDNWGKVNEFDLVFTGGPIGHGLVFEESVLYTSFVRVFVDGERWEDTPWFQNMMRLMDERGYVYRCTSREKLIARLENEVGLIYRSMQAHGYLSQADIMEALWLETPSAADLKPFQDGTYHSSIAHEHEIKFGLNEDGELLFLDGRHRYTIARLLRIAQVPARVVFRHQQWLQRKAALEALSGASLLGRGDAVIDHPDLPRLRFSARRRRKVEALFQANCWPLPPFRSE